MTLSSKALLPPWIFGAGNKDSQIDLSTERQTEIPISKTQRSKIQI